MLSIHLAIQFIPYLIDITSIGKRETWPPGSESEGELGGTILPEPPIWDPLGLYRSISDVFARHYPGDRAALSPWAGSFQDVLGLASPVPASVAAGVGLAPPGPAVSGEAGPASPVACVCPRLK